MHRRLAADELHHADADHRRIADDAPPVVGGHGSAGPVGAAGVVAVGALELTLSRDLQPQELRHQPSPFAVGCYCPSSLWGTSKPADGALTAESAGTDLSHSRVLVQQATHRAITYVEPCGDLANAPALLVQPHGVFGQPPCLGRVAAVGQKALNLLNGIAAVAARSLNGDDPPLARPLRDCRGADAERLGRLPRREEAGRIRWGHRGLSSEESRFSCERWLWRRILGCGCRREAAADEVQGTPRR